MQIEAEVSQEGILMAKVPDRYCGKSVRIRIEEPNTPASAQWRDLSAVFNRIEAADIPRRRHQDILDSVRDFRESR